MCVDQPNRKKSRRQPPANFIEPFSGPQPTDQTAAALLFKIALVSSPNSSPIPSFFLIRFFKASSYLPPLPGGFPGRVTFGSPLSKRHPLPGGVCCQLQSARREKQPGGNNSQQSKTMVQLYPYEKDFSISLAKRAVFSKHVLQLQQLASNY